MCLLGEATVPPTTSSVRINSSFEIKQNIQGLPLYFSLRLSFWFYFPFSGIAIGSSSMKTIEQLPWSVSTLVTQLPVELRVVSWWFPFLSSSPPAIKGPRRARLIHSLSKHIHTACLLCGGDVIQHSSWHVEVRDMFTEE